MSFNYNQFANPNNPTGTYHSGHFNDTSTGISYPTEYKGYHVHTNPRRRWMISETINDNSKPIFRSHYNGESVSTTLLMNPTARDGASMFSFSDPPAATSKASGGGNAAANKAALAKLNAILASGGTSTFGSFSDRLALKRAADENTSSSSGESAVVTLTTDLSVAKEGVFSYLDYDQKDNIVIDSMGGKKMNIMAFKEPGPSSSLTIAYSSSGGIGSGLNVGTASSIVIADPVITFHGKPVQNTTTTPGIPSGFKQTLLENISGTHTHYFPLRGQVINGYKVNHSENNHYTDNYIENTIPKFPNNSVGTHYGSKGARYSMNLSLKTPNTHQFRMF
jgi:hypothetical protein